MTELRNEELRRSKSVLWPGVLAVAAAGFSFVALLDLAFGDWGHGQELAWVGALVIATALAAAAVLFATLLLFWRRGWAGAALLFFGVAELVVSLVFWLRAIG